ncbi:MULTISPECIES: Lacal_2735 family protein [Hanstruepera]|uniref:Lacal_2735 family protein n=1 Tax=Hanstruepera TaxID=1707752 RepID=UPI001CA701EE|nr:MULTISPECIES: Lacal_2735 family protein [Hanstruepera]
MFGLFKKQSELKVLQKKYAKAMKDWHKLSVTDRKASDNAYAEAQSISDKIEALQNKTK